MAEGPQPRELIDGLQMRHRGPAERRQVHALQRADADGRRRGRQLSVLHHRAQHRRRRRARPAARPAGGYRQVRRRRADAPHLRRHRRPGARRLQGRGPRQPVPRPHPRGRRRRLRAALLRGPGRDARRGPDRSDRRRRDGRDRADAGRPRQPGAPARAAGEEGAGRRQGGQGAARPDRQGAGAGARRQAGAGSRASARKRTGSGARCSC